MSAIEIGGILTGHEGIDGWVYNETNTANGIGCKHRFYNYSGKAIKYITFTYLPYNRVNDVVTCQINGNSEASARLTGPIEPNEEYEAKWDVLWYNPTIKNVELKDVFVQYMDGTEETIPGNEVLSIYAPESEYQKQKALKTAAEEERKSAEAALKKQQLEETMQTVNALKDSVVGGLKSLFKKK